MVVVKMRIDPYRTGLLVMTFTSSTNARAAAGVVPSSTSNTSWSLTITTLLLPNPPVA
jgi:hypothetical protein